MRILVIDDNETCRAAAIAQLSDHETTITGSYDEGQRLVRDKHEFEVVLVDLLMPASWQTLGSRGAGLGGVEMPVGIFLALLAAKNGAKYVAVFTDSDHHSHPASACFDAFNRNETWAISFSVEGARVILSNNRNWINHFQPENLANEMEFDEWYSGDKLAVKTKNWLKVLEYLLSGKHIV